MPFDRRRPPAAGALHRPERRDDRRPSGPDQQRGPSRALLEPRAAPAVFDGRLVVGLQPVREAIRAHGAQLLRVAIDRRPQPRLDALERFARDQGVPTVVRLPAGELDATAGSAQHQGAIAWAPSLSLVDAESLFTRPHLVALALDQVQDPQNFGATIRSAVALARAPVVWAEHASAPLTPATFRASAGAVEHAELCRVPSLITWLEAARDSDIQVLGLDAHAPERLASCDLGRSTVIVVGSEHEGLRRSTRRACTQLVSLVSPGAIDSLNASVAAAIALFAIVDQRAKSGV